MQLFFSQYTYTVWWCCMLNRRQQQHDMIFVLLASPPAVCPNIYLFILSIIIRTSHTSHIRDSTFVRIALYDLIAHNTVRINAPCFFVFAQTDNPAEIGSFFMKSSKAFLRTRVPKKKKKIALSSVHRIDKYVFSKDKHRLRAIINNNYLTAIRRVWMDGTQYKTKYTHNTTRCFSTLRCVTLMARFHYVESRQYNQWFS